MSKPLGMVFPRDEHEAHGDMELIGRVLDNFKELDEGAVFQVVYWRPEGDEMVQCGKFDRWTEIGYVTYVKEES